MSVIRGVPFRLTRPPVLAAASPFRVEVPEPFETVVNLAGQTGEQLRPERLAPALADRLAEHGYAWNAVLGVWWRYAGSAGGECDNDDRV